MIHGLTSPIGLGISFGLFFGKPIGILLTSFICTKLKISSLPEGSRWAHIIGVGFLAGIGFTMSIFVSLLSYSDPLFVAEAKLSILLTSIIAGLVGFFFLKSLAQKK